ncbi:carbamoyltransferase [Streptomyces sp. RGM 3693]|uniref:carbamoyltransferase family protein n=1 Tax=Streptomyces sp. RGM 3693 TaxID=3413284 RepID=UPI003D2D019E
MTNILGVSCRGHDAAVSVVRDGELVYASHCERYSRVKNDPQLAPAAVADALSRVDRIDAVVHYERPLRTRTRQLRAGQFASALDPHGLRAYLRSVPGLRRAPVHTVGHHESHAAGGYFTSGFDEAAVVVVDAIGEWDTISVWSAHGTTLTKVAGVRYPHSIGLLYSAFTQRVGFRPNEEEYIMMGLAAYGTPDLADLIWDDFVRCADWPDFRLTRSVHRGIADWRPHLTDAATLAASVQEVTERLLDGLFAWAARAVGSRNLVYSGGVALNCAYNSQLARSGAFDRIWIMPSPGDSGSAIGAALALLRRHVSWPGPYLGHAITGEPDLDEAVRRLVRGEVIGMAHGRSEFGPRALGNRSLLADPRPAAAKRKVNAIKRREQFRPFAPAVLAEHAPDLFDLPVPHSPYMQYVAPCRDPEQLLSVCHVDGTSRVQTVRQPENPVFHELLTRFHHETGCPVLLNTSLNIKGEPLVNTRADAQRFQKSHGIPVL